ncbi:MAG TPA: ferredoxin family protein [Thermoplasmata archaeon]|nr:ferredoxin family protein [Thermoplasmata archaeon]
MTIEVDYKSKAIDPDFMNKPDEYPPTGEHQTHKVFAEGKNRPDADGKPYPTALGVHGTHVAVDWDSCIADGACMDVCPVEVFEWFLAPGTWGTGKHHPIEKGGGEEWDKYRTDKCDPIRESDCIDCMACETACPVLSIKITPG